MLGQLVANWRLIAAGGALLLSGVLGWQVNGWRLNEKISELEAKHATELANATQRARQMEHAMQKEVDAARRDRDVRIAAVTARLNDVTERMRERPERPAGSGIYSLAGQTSAACTGAQLYREDRVFLIREAAVAETIRAGYLQCIAQYEKVKQALEK